MADQAQNLRNVVRERQRRARVLAVTSGKGGVGKTGTSVNLAIALANLGRQVVVLDADLGLANVEVLLGLNSIHNLQEVAQGTRTVNEILVKGPGGIHLVPGSSGISRVADLGPRARQNILDALKQLQDRFDFVIIDTMAGIGQNAVAFAAAADEVLLVTTPEPSAMVDGYAMLKTIHQMRHDAVFRIIVNMVANEQQANAVAEKLSAVSQQFMSRTIPYLGHIPRDPHVSHGVMQSTPFILKYPAAPASRAIDAIAVRLIHQRPETQQTQQSFFKRFAATFGLASNG